MPHQMYPPICIPHEIYPATMHASRSSIGFLIVRRFFFFHFVYLISSIQRKKIKPNRVHSTGLIDKAREAEKRRRKKSDFLFFNVVEKLTRRNVGLDIGIING
eukprot:gb/GEZN01013933.1/.p2 GENE.gb/GEZN01013933.1/~~gb/GEZN01013933.1/.p2  ORF type:complete len:103 (-),score=7.47 gb/GEZN01013933.1/:354-662(-)